MVKFLSGLLGDPNEKEVRKIEPLVDRINAFEPELQALSDDDLRAKSDELRSRLAGKEMLDDILPEAFACVREAS